MVLFLNQQVPRILGQSRASVTRDMRTWTTVGDSHLHLVLDENIHGIYHNLKTGSTELPVQGNVDAYSLCVRQSLTSSL